MSVLEEVRDLAEAITRRRSLRLYDVEVGGRPGQTVVRVFVEREGGLDLDTVSKVSEELSRGLDLKDPIPGRYTLEVSSPGLDRPLYRPRDYARFTGRLARVTYRAPESGAKRTVVGRLEAFHPERDEVVLAVQEGERLLLNLNDIQNARLEVEL